jgi:hypothetical protein
MNQNVLMQDILQMLHHDRLRTMLFWLGGHLFKFFEQCILLSRAIMVRLPSAGGDRQNKPRRDQL